MTIGRGEKRRGGEREGNERREWNGVLDSAFDGS